MRLFTSPTFVNTYLSILCSNCYSYYILYFRYILKIMIHLYVCWSLVIYDWSSLSLVLLSLVYIALHQHWNCQKYYHVMIIIRLAESVLDNTESLNISNVNQTRVDYIMFYKTRESRNPKNTLLLRLCMHQCWFRKIFGIFESSIATNESHPFAWFLFTNSLNNSLA